MVESQRNTPNYGRDITLWQRNHPYGSSGATLRQQNPAIPAHKSIGGENQSLP